MDLSQESKLGCDWRSVTQYVLWQAPCWDHGQILVMILILAVFVVVARPLWLEMGSVICREVLVSVIYSQK